MKKLISTVLAGVAVIGALVASTGPAAAVDGKVKMPYGEGSAMLVDHGDYLNIHVGAKDTSCDARGVQTLVTVYRDNGHIQMREWGYTEKLGCNFSGSTPYTLTLKDTKNVRSGTYTIHVCKQYGIIGYDCSLNYTYTWKF